MFYALYKFFMTICPLLRWYIAVFLLSFISFAYGVSWPDLTCATLHSTPRENLLSLFVHGLFQVAYPSTPSFASFLFGNASSNIMDTFRFFLFFFFRTFYISNCFICFLFLCFFSPSYYQCFFVNIFLAKKEQRKR